MYNCTASCTVHVMDIPVEEIQVKLLFYIYR